MAAKPASTEEQSKPISLLEKGVATEEVQIIKNYLLAALIKHAFNFFSLATVAGYIFLFWGTLKFYPLFYAVLLILLMTPYFWLMLKALPILKIFYTEKYAMVSVDAHDITCDAPLVDKM
ncbi:uncharacterized protein LOC124700554 [Lolium rigidum]|uniref:uncharacterized protein LOC124700554 n=1 Tax=Lolium rigidum TaxID=89674 RepID=UPI001F5C1A89|nr:uncharacterized protein LOC124700554 [Lolium rigidum]